jgi:hypothetical protein
MPASSQRLLCLSALAANTRFTCAIPLMHDNSAGSSISIVFCYHRACMKSSQDKAKISSCVTQQ